MCGASDVIGKIKITQLRWAGYIQRMDEIKVIMENKKEERGGGRPKIYTNIVLPSMPKPSSILAKWSAHLILLDL